VAALRGAAKTMARQQAADTPEPAPEPSR
jgi:hypothetical protein